MDSPRGPQLLGAQCHPGSTTRPTLPAVRRRGEQRTDTGQVPANAAGDYGCGRSAKSVPVAAPGLIQRQLFARSGGRRRLFAASVDRGRQERRRRHHHDSTYNRKASGHRSGVAARAAEAKAGAAHNHSESVSSAAAGLAGAPCRSRAMPGADRCGVAAKGLCSATTSTIDAGVKTITIRPARDRR